MDKNTDLTGGIISSEANPDKNNLSTGTLTFTDVHNEAAYSSANKGININTGAGADRKDAGITPNIGMPAQGNAASDTKATISQGTIEIKDKEHQQQDISTLNRDTNDSLNKLGEIFDKQTIEERQELSAMFGEEAYKEIHKIAEKNGWEEGSPQKNALHALIGGIMSELSNNNFLSGASGAAVNEMLQDKLEERFKNNPAVHQWASSLIGGIVSKIISNNINIGASSASSGTKNNAYGVRPTYDGAIIFVPGLGYFKVINGKDVYMDSIPPENVYVWIQDITNPSYGWDYKKGNGNDIPDKYIDEKIYWSGYIQLASGEVLGVAFIDYIDEEKTIMIKELGKKYIESMISANSARGRDILDSIKNDSTKMDEIIKEIPYEHLKNLFGNIIQSYYPGGH